MRSSRNPSSLPWTTTRILWIFAVLHPLSQVSSSSTTTTTSRSASLAFRTNDDRLAFFGRMKQEVKRPNDDNNSPNTINPLLLLRGGSTTAAAAATTTSTKATLATTQDKQALRAYRWQQQLYLQSRSMQLRQALLARGLDGLHHSPEALEEAKKHVPVDWDCALATRQHPKSCLYSFDAEPGTKVVAPHDTKQWITLSALNRLRRNDPTKVEPLWHSQYSIMSTWLNPESEYSMYHHLSPAGSLLSFLLDSPLVLIGGMMLVLTTAFLVTMPFWESLMTTFLTSSMLWLQWPNWGRFLHAALPFKLLLGQMAWKFIAFLLGKVYGDLRQRLVELECQMWEDCMPLTVLEGRMAAEAAAAAAAAAQTAAEASMEMLQEEEAAVDSLDDEVFFDAREDDESDGQAFFDAQEDEVESSEADVEEVFYSGEEDLDDFEVFSDED